MTKITAFNIRVYGLFINNMGEVLLADELRFDKMMTKFPGGGLQFGEGPIDCLKREGIEEFGQEIEIMEHFYTTDFFQQALFYEDQQLLSIYYRARFKEEEQFIKSNIPFDFKNANKTEPISFRYAALDELKEEDLTYPIDKFVVKLLKIKGIK
jgi:8-oxo-dGTP diphosphatase